jgi:pyrimidine-nucleoside phosphorylase
MDILEIIDKKRLGKELTKEELTFFVNGFLDGKIKDYQMSAILMAITINGMTDQETEYLTDIMLNSGDILDTSMINGLVLDKHSTGGIGDKVTLVLCPLLASFGIKIAKMSGRGLGYTGGTIDKLESIPGFRVDLTEEEFFKQVNDSGIVISSPNKDLDKADKKIYALRDVTSTVSSIPLIASSIMSKKLACNADVILIDVKVGNGALMKNIEDANALARLLCKLGRHHNKAVICLLSNMDQPLGYAIGNALEVKESIMTLQGNGPSDLLEIVVKLATMVVGPINKLDEEQAQNLVFKQLNNGLAYNKFKEMVKYQGGDLDSLRVSSKIISIKSDRSGYINQIDSQKLGSLANLLGAGKQTEEDSIDYEVGIVLSKKVGDYVNANEELLRLYINEKTIDIPELLSCFVIEKQLREPQPVIYGIIK